jgi:hypothetical protein
MPKFLAEQYRGVVARNKPGASSFYPSVLLRLTTAQDWKSLGMVVDAEAFVTVNQIKNRYINPVEAYNGSGSRPQILKVHGGRKKEEWSELDDRWKLGMWQPRFRWDYFNPEVVGLTGLFFSTQQGGLKLAAYASPLFIPEQGAPFEVDNGKFSSYHPFFSPPPDTMQVFGQTTPLRYDVVIPPISKIVINPGGSALARYDFSNGVHIKGSYGYMPMNQLAIGYQGYLYLNTNQVQVTLHPRVIYRHIAALDTGWRNDRFALGLDFLADMPLQSGVSTDMTTQNYSTGYMVSPAFSARVNNDIANPHTVELSSIQTMGGVKDDTGPLATTGQQILESRYQYRNAVQLRWRLPMVSTEKTRVYGMSRFVYDFSVQGVILSPEVRFDAGKRFFVTLGADAVGAGKRRATDGGADFFNLYKANDRIRGSIAYAF